MQDSKEGDKDHQDEAREERYARIHFALIESNMLTCNNKSSTCNNTEAPSVPIEAHPPSIAHSEEISTRRARTAQVSSSSSSPFTSISTVLSSLSLHNLSFPSFPSREGREGCSKQMDPERELEEGGAAVITAFQPGLKYTHSYH